MSHKGLITLYTDGSAGRIRYQLDADIAESYFNIGGWAYIWEMHGKMHSDYGGEFAGTVGMMEVKALLQGLDNICLSVDPTKTYRIEVFSDSKYVVESGSEWIYTWVVNGWKRTDGKSIRHKSLWQRIYALITLEHLDVHFYHVKGHSGVYGNEFCDKRAGAARKVLVDKRMYFLKMNFPNVKFIPGLKHKKKEK